MRYTGYTSPEGQVGPHVGAHTFGSCGRRCGCSPSHAAVIRMIPGGRTGATSRLSPISGCGLFHQRGHTQQITHGLSNRFGNNSRDAANRTLPRLPVQPQIASDSRHQAFVDVNPRNTQQLSRRFALPYTFGKWRSRLRLSVRWRASNRCSIRP